jgi:NAD(P) transhydrogenase beta subunit
MILTVFRAMFNGEQGGLTTDEPNVSWVKVVVSLINTYAGLSVAVAGLVLDNTVMVVAGVILVGSSSVLVKVMARR